MKPIPDLAPNTGWRDIAIEPVDEPLARIDELHPRIFDRPRYVQWGVPQALPESWVRRGVGERLVRVVESLSSDRALIVWDGYRPLAVQAALFDDWEGRLRREHPLWGDDQIYAQASRFVTPPSDDPTAPPPHLTGGAVDLTLGDDAGVPIDMGTDFDAFVDEAHALALENSPCDARDSRRTLFWAMHDAGFTGYAEEWWHFDFGDQFWGLATNHPARYGPARLDAGAQDEDDTLAQTDAR